MESVGIRSYMDLRREVSDGSWYAVWGGCRRGDFLKSLEVGV